MRSVDKGAPPVGEDGNALAFGEYQEAGPYLMKRIGRYCSYCERAIRASLAVEHKMPKTQQPNLELDWANLLLACSNCNSTKGSKRVEQGAVAWPDEDDTASMVAYHRSGKVDAAVGLSQNDLDRVSGLLDLVGLRKPLSELGSTDHRWFDRLEVWRQAEDSLQDLDAQPTEAMRRRVLATAIATGGYSIWMTVFAGRPDMRSALAQSFPGTRLAAA